VDAEGHPFVQDMFSTGALGPHPIDTSQGGTDDILDYTAPLEESGKDLANDLRQGKTTLPLLLACEQDQTLLEAVTVLSKQGPTEEKCQEIVRRVLETPAIERARDLAGELVGRAKKFLAEFPDGPAVESLRELTSYIVDRVTIR